MDCTYFSGNDSTFFSIKVQHLFEIINYTFINIYKYHKYLITHIINIFTVTFDQCNVSLLFKSINLFFIFTFLKEYTPNF